MAACRGWLTRQLLLLQLLVGQEPLLQQVSPAVAAAVPAAADHPVARDDDGDLQSTQKSGRS